MEVKIEKITPTVATKYLEANRCNRPVSAAHLDKISREMLEGTWANNGDSIRFNVRGELVDGQHRLLACVQTGTTLTCPVVRGLDVKAFDTIDQGMRRTIAQILAMRGEANTPKLAAAIQCLIRFESGDLDSNRKHVFASTREVEAYLDANPAVRDVLTLPPMVRQLFTPSLMSAFRFKARQLNTTRDDILMETLQEGSPDGMKCPFHVLRELVTRVRIGHRVYPPRIQWGLLAKAWNAKALDKRVQVLIFRDDEQFPDLRP